MAFINGTPTPDSLVGEVDEADIIFGFEGNDTLLGLGENDTLVGGAGEDIISGFLGDDILFGNTEIDDLLGEEGNDSIAAGRGDDRVQGGQGEDLLFGNLGNDYIAGGENNDTIFGGKDDDILVGGSGNDAIFGDIGSDFIQGVDLDIGEFSQFGLGEIDTLTGGSEGDFFVLGDETRSFYIGSGNNDFAVITDFQSGEDIIIVQTIDNIVLTDFSIAGLGDGVGIFVTTETQNELIGFVRGLSAAQLNLSVDFLSS